MDKMTNEEKRHYFWLGDGQPVNNTDLWASLHAHFEKQARGNGGAVEETHVTGKGKERTVNRDR